MGVDWSRGMRQSFELVEVDADTWTEGAEHGELVSATVTYEDEGQLCSAELESDEQFSTGYYRLYIVAEQDGEAERVPVATVLCESDTLSSDGKHATYDATGYSPLKELDDTAPRIGWAVGSGTSVMSAVKAVLSEHCRAPKSYAVSSTATCESYVAEEDDSWLDVVEDLLAQVSAHLEVDGWGRVLVVPDADSSALSPAVTWTDSPDDGEASVSLPDLEVDFDRADVPNRYEAVLSGDSSFIVAAAQNDDPASEVSTVSRGRVVLERDTSPDVDDGCTQGQLEQYALDMLAEATQQTVTYTYQRGFWPGVHVGTCVELVRELAGVTATGVVCKQVVSCETGCTVEETVKRSAGLDAELSTADFYEGSGADDEGEDD